MILQALHDYYQRKGDLPLEGFAHVEIPFLLTISADGRFLAVEDTREGEGRAQRARAFLMPRPVQRSGSKSYAVTNLLWDHIGYVLGHAKSGEPKDETLAKAQHGAWLESISTLLRRFPEEPGLLAMQGFYASNQIGEVMKSAQWADMIRIPGCNLAFRLEGMMEPVPCGEFVKSLVQNEDPSTTDEDEAGEGLSESRQGICLVTGAYGEIVRIHGKTPISKDSKSLVNFQTNSGYDSYGKSQGYNAPVGKAAEAAYTSALKHLLRRDSRQKVQVADTTTLFWAGKEESPLENSFAALFGLPDKDNPDAEPEAVRSLLSMVMTGQDPSTSETPFFVLGLSPSSTRIAVRFWHSDTVAGMSKKLVQHLEDLDMVRGSKDDGRRALMALLCDLVLKGKVANVPPNLAGQVMRAALTGGPYPRTLLQLAIRRIRAEREVTRIRAAVLKAVLNRSQKNSPTPSKEITVSLDPTNLSPGYRLGRLFAILEKIQEDAQRGITSTIRERFYGAASSSPASVFPQLLKLKNHHLAKLNNPAFRRAHEIRLGEVFDGIQTMPAHLPMDEQARFAIGYYHQRQALWTKSAKPEISSTDPTQNQA